METTTMINGNAKRNISSGKFGGSAGLKSGVVHRRLYHARPPGERLVDLINRVGL